MKLRDANLQVQEKNSFTHPPSCIQPSFFKNTSGLLLLKSFWSVRAQFLSGNTSELLLIYLFNYDSSKSTFSMLNMELDVLVSIILLNKLELIRFLQCKDYKKHPSFLLCALCSVFCYVLFYKNLIVLHHGDNKFLINFAICIKFTLSLIIQPWKSDNISFDVYFFMIRKKNMYERKKTFRHSKI